MKKQKYALVLSGGGFKGAFQLGALNHLQQQWKRINPNGGPMRFDIISGVSVGALNGVSEIYTSDFIETDPSTGELRPKLDAKSLQKQFFPNLEFKLGFFKGLGLLLSKKKRKAYFRQLMEAIAQEAGEQLPNFKALADNSPLREKLSKLLDQKAIVGSEFLCGYVSLDDGRYSAVTHSDFNSNEDFVNGVLASTVVPMVWEPVQEIRYNTHSTPSRNLVDGGIRNISPLGDVISRINQDPEDAEYTIVIINCANGGITEKSHTGANLLQIGLRSLQEITLSEIFTNDTAHFMQLNSILEQLEEQGAEVELRKHSHARGQLSETPLKKFRSILIEPQDDELGDFLEASEALLAQRQQHGEDQARKALENFQPKQPEKLRA